MKSILLIKKLLGLVEMTSGLVNANFSLPKGHTVKMIFFAPCSAPDSLGFFFVFYLFTFAFEGGNFIRWQRVL